MNAVTSITGNLPRFDGTKSENYRDWHSRTREVLSVPNQDVLGVLNGVTEPTPIFTNTDTPDIPADPAEICRWKRACENNFSVLYVIASGPAVTLVRQHEYRNSAGVLGNGQQAWNALYANYHSDSKEARRACCKKLVNVRMEKGQDPAGNTSKLL